MSGLTGNNVKGLMEAYAAVYAPQQQPQELTEQTTEENYIQEDFEIDPDALLESVKEYLVTVGYAKGEKEAINMLPHLSENFFHNICSQIIITEVFYQNVNSLVEEGYDLSEYTWDELFESYIDGIGQENLNEVAVAAPLVGPALAGITSLVGGATKLWQDLQKQKAQKNTPEEEKWLRTGSFKSEKKPLEAKPRGSQTTVPTATGRTSPAPAPQPQWTSTSGGSGGGGSRPPSGGSGGGGGGNKPPKIDPLQTLKDVGKGVQKAFGPGGSVRQAVKQTLGKPARQRFFGSTRGGQITRGATTAGLSALDIAGKAFDPSKPSALSAVGSLGPGAVGTVLQGTGNIPVIKGTSLGTGARGTGEYLRQLGRDMRDQPPGKPPWKYGQKTQSMRGF